MNIAEKLKKSGNIVSVGYMLRYLKVVQKMKWVSRRWTSAAWADALLRVPGRSSRRTTSRSWPPTRATSWRSECFRSQLARSG
jgi:hypothetical protein